MQTVSKLPFKQLYRVRLPAGSPLPRDLHEHVADMTKPLLSRNGSTSPFGKLDDVVTSFKIDSETKVEAARLASSEGMALHEWIRELIRGRVYGAETMKKLHASRVDRVLGK